MSLADLIHAHAYTYPEQVLDGVHGQEAVVPPHLVLGDYSDEDSTAAASNGTVGAEHAHLNAQRNRRRRAKEARLKARADTLNADYQRRDRVPVASTSGLQRKAAYTPPTAASFYIPSLPGLSADSTLSLYGGHLPSTVTSSTAPPTEDGDGEAPDEGDAHLFFFLAKAKHIAQSEKLVIWLNGGPGCSSFDGALMEIGPLRMAQGKRGELFEQEGAWNEYANVMFIDQPAGTGYSYVSKNRYVKSGQDAAKQVVTFLKNFYEVFPEYERMDTYIAGESFAGIWIPYLATELQNTKLVQPPLKGLLIGNGWIDPYHQYPAYVDFSYQESLLQQGTTTAAALAKVGRVLERCNKERERIGFDKFPINHGPCESILSTITETTIQTVNGKKLCVNNYDIRLTDTHPACGMNWPNLLPDMYSYLPKPDVIAAFHASSKPSAGWAECNGHVNDAFWGRTKPSVHLLPKLLESGLPILLFSGMQDLICNHVGTEHMIDNMTWSGETGWGDFEEGSAQDRKNWFVDGKKAGTWQTSRNLTYVQVYNSSHMVPFDLPVVAHDMLSRFLETDYIAAAGGSAKVPSRIGDEQEAIIGETHLNGSALDTSITSGQLAGLEDATESTNIENPVTDAYYNIGAALLILFTLILLGVYFIWRQRRRKHRYGGFGSHAADSLPLSISNGVKGQARPHRRNKSSMSDYRQAAGSDAEEANELLPMEKRGEDGTGAQAGASNSQLDLPRGEELFAVGEDDEDALDSDDEGNLGRAGRKMSALSDDVKGAQQTRYDV